MFAYCDHMNFWDYHDHKPYATDRYFFGWSLAAAVKRGGVKGRQRLHRSSRPRALLRPAARTPLLTGARSCRVLRIAADSAGGLKPQTSLNDTRFTVQISEAASSCDGAQIHHPQ